MFFSQPELKDCIQEVAWLVASLGGVFAAFKAISEIKNSTEQRRMELFWRRSNAARELVQELHRHNLASSAVLMMDRRVGKHAYTQDDHEFQISYEDVRRVLAKAESESTEPSEDFIRESFDWFFYFLDRIEHYIRTGYINFADVKAIFGPYVRKFIADRAIYQKFIELHEYVLVVPFIERFSQNGEGETRDETLPT